MESENFNVRVSLTLIIMKGTPISELVTIKILLWCGDHRHHEKVFMVKSDHQNAHVYTARLFLVGKKTLANLVDLH